MRKTVTKAKARGREIRDLKVREDKARRVQGGLLPTPTSPKVNTLTFSSSGTGIG